MKRLVLAVALVHMLRVSCGGPAPVAPSGPTYDHVDGTTSYLVLESGDLR